MYDKHVLLLRYQVLVNWSIKQYDSDKQTLERKIDGVDKKIPNTSGLVKKTDYKTKITEIENKIPSDTCLVTTAALNTKATKTENKIPATGFITILEFRRIKNKFWCKNERSNEKPCQ